jgi:hypothetical protein
MYFIGLLWLSWCYGMCFFILIQLYISQLSALAPHGEAVSFSLSRSIDRLKQSAI